ncbi:hypothetical protein AC578_2336 [Pseudocercospora eumusae]|uniref:Uncharacterized protein n=1 Tax=Pseudocercospora eumusae TaxID=321146 RepID=A0A139HXP4_9PEZI|nr:hypothetical protein AC578_2336 [Pseudocercospora eumusae]
MKVLAIALVLTGSAMALPILVRRGDLVPATNDAYVEYYIYSDYGSYQPADYGDYPYYPPPDSGPPPTKDDAAAVNKALSGVEE